jgi:hypothetical protein
MTDTTSALACDLTVLPSGGLERLTRLGGTLFAMAREARELPDGYAIGFHGATPELLAELAEFISLDRVCCAFLRHSLVSEPGPGTIWLELAGPEGAKEAIAGDLARLLPDELAVTAGLTTATARA